MKTTSLQEEETLIHQFTSSKEPNKRLKLLELMNEIQNLSNQTLISFSKILMSETISDERQIIQIVNIFWKNQNVEAIFVAIPFLTQCLTLNHRQMDIYLVNIFTNFLKSHKDNLQHFLKFNCLNRIIELYNYSFSHISSFKADCTSLLEEIYFQMNCKERFELYERVKDYPYFRNLKFECLHISNEFMENQFFCLEDGRIFHSPIESFKGEFNNWLYFDSFSDQDCIPSRFNLVTNKIEFLKVKRNWNIRESLVLDFSNRSIYNPDEFFNGNGPLCKANIHPYNISFTKKPDETIWIMLWEHKQIQFFSFSETALTRKHSFLLQEIIASACSNSDGDVFILTSKRILKYHYSNGAFSKCIFAYLEVVEFPFSLLSQMGASKAKGPSISLNCDSSLLVHYDKSITIFDCKTKKILFVDSFPSTDEYNREPKFSKFDPDILFCFDEFSIKVFRISKYQQGKDLYQCMIQSIPIKKNTPVLGLFSSSNGKYLFVQDNEGISRFKIAKENKDVLKTIKLKDIQFQFY
jgi:hypothetical protein